MEDDQPFKLVFGMVWFINNICLTVCAGVTAPTSRQPPGKYKGKVQSCTGAGDGALLPKQAVCI